VDVRARGYILVDDYQPSNGGLKGGLIQGSRVTPFYVKNSEGELIRSMKAAFSNGIPVPAELTGVIMPGRDFETKAPNGALAFQVQGFEPVRSNGVAASPPKA
jgi:hypothetical protein